MSNELAKTRGELRSILENDKFKEQLQLAMPKHLTPEVVSRIAITALAKIPRLASCTPASFCNCLLDLTAAGLVPDGRRAHLIPRGDQCTLLIDYKGYVEIVRRDPKVSTLRAELVCEFDTFDHDRGEILAHTWPIGGRGEILGAYAEVVYVDGGRQSAIMSKGDIEQIRDRSAQGTSRADSPWNTAFGEMAKKTVIRRLTKMLTLPPGAAAAEAADGKIGEKPVSGIARSVPIDPFDQQPTNDPPPAEKAELQHDAAEADGGGSQPNQNHDEENLI